MSSLPIPDPPETNSEPEIDALVEAIESFSEDVRQRIAVEIQKAEEAHAPQLQQLRERIKESVKRELGDAIRQEFDVKYQESLKKLRDQFTRKVEQAAIELEIERKRMHNELSSLRSRDGHVTAELSAKEAALEAMDREMAAMIDNPEIEISRVIRHNAQQSELKAYIRGLRFLLGEKPSEPQGSVE
jgi:hypothetical protein